MFSSFSSRDVRPLNKRKSFPVMETSVDLLPRFCHKRHPNIAGIYSDIAVIFNVSCIVVAT